jgi:hypothetical protein
MRIHAISASSFVLISVMHVGSAFGYSAIISGKVEQYVELGNYCSNMTIPPMDCTASMFPAAHTNTTRPFQHVTIVLRDQSDSTIGLGGTDDNGNFSIAWNSGSIPSSIQIRLLNSETNGRFSIRTSDGATIWWGVVTTINNPGLSNWNVGTWGWYSYVASNNAFEATRLGWDNAWKFSADMLSRFYTQIWLGASSTYHSNGNVMLREADVPSVFIVNHEVGHVIDHLQTAKRSCGAWNWAPGATCTGAGTPASCNQNPPHDFGSSEWYCSSFTEGWAHFAATTMLYGLGASQPLICASVGTCPTGYNVETSSGSGCAEATRRQPIHVARYIWDTYDNVNDTGVYNDIVPSWPGVRFAQIFDNLDLFPAGKGDHQVDEAWNSTATEIDAPDGRSAADWKYHNDPVQNTSDQFTYNCAPGT